MEIAAAILLFLACCICTVRTRFVQFRRFGSALHRAVGRKSFVNGVTPLAACATSLAATLGTGNIAGVAGALAIGGPGAVLWMWMSAFAGMGAKYLDIYYGMRFRRQDCIGPMAYMEGALPKRLSALSIAYASVCAIACLCMGNLVQISAMSEAAVKLVNTLSIAGEYSWLPIALGVTCAVFIGVVQLGGVRRVGAAASLLVPLMSMVYIAFALAVLFSNVARIPGAIKSIFECALQPRAILTGIARGTFTHEAGLGTAAIAHAGTVTEDAHQQALFGIFEVFFDTIVMCTITALAILTAMSPEAISACDGQNSAVVIAAFSMVLGETAAALSVTISLILFALTSVLSFSHYGGVCARYLFGKRGQGWYCVLFLLLLCVGGIIRSAFLWRIAEWVNIAMGLLNMFALLTITGKPRGPTLSRGGAR